MQNCSQTKDRIRWRISKKKLTKRQEQLINEYYDVNMKPPTPPSISSVGHLVPRFLSRPRNEEVNKEHLLALMPLNRTCASQHKQPTTVRKLSSKKVLISEDQKTRLAKVFPKHLNKLQILGKGAVSVIWLAFDTNLQKNVAVKQFLKDCHESFEREKRFVKELEKMSSCDKFIQCQYSCRLANTDFMVYEVANCSLGKALYQMKGQFYNNERVYKINLTNFYWNFIKPSSLRTFIGSMAVAIGQLMNHDFSHNDLKPENILLDDQNNIKICDYGSMSRLNSSQVRNMITPEYMPPQVLLGYDSSLIDVWSLGIIIVQLLNGIPIWMCYKCWIEHENMNIVNCGLLAVKGKQYEKIVSRIKHLRRNLSEAISFGTRGYSRGDLNKLINLLERLLELDPEVRIRPEEILKHDFMVQK